MLARQSIAVLVAIVPLAGCPPEDEDLRPEAAEYFGLVENRELTYDVTATGSPTPTTSKITFKKTESFADKLAFISEERNQGNLVVETLTFAAEPEELQLLRMGDCVPDCIEMVSPPPIIKHPQELNTSFESQTSTRVTASTGTADGAKQRHSLTIGGESDVVTPAGTFRAILVSWRIYTDGQTGSEDREMYFAPGKGFVQIKKGGFTYKVRLGVTP